MLAPVATESGRFTRRRVAALVAINASLLLLFDQAVLRIPISRLAGNVGIMLETTDRSEPPYLRLRPGIDVEYQSPGAPDRRTRVRTNSMGYRDRERSWSRTAGLRRVVAIGDSHTFSLGVELSDAYPTQLEGELQRSGENVEVWNAGTPGHQMRDHVGTLRLLQKARPDVVILQLTANDAVVPYRLAPWLLSSSRHSGLARLYMVGRLNFGADKEDFGAANATFLAEARRGGAAVVMWSESTPEGTDARLARNADDAGAAFVQPLRGERYPQEGDSSHLSPLGNRVVAERLAPSVRAALARAAESGSP